MGQDYETESLLCMYTVIVDNKSLVLYYEHTKAGSRLHNCRCPKTLRGP